MKIDLNWVEFMPVLPFAANVKLDAGQLHRACVLAQRVHAVVPDPTPNEIAAALGTDPSLREFSAALNRAMSRP